MEDNKVYINLGTYETPIWTAPAKQKDLTYSSASDSTDTTSKDDSGYKSTTYTFLTEDLKFSGVYVQGDPALAKMRSVQRLGGALNRLDTIVKRGLDQAFRGYFGVASIDESGSVGDMMTYDTSLTNQGEVIEIDPSILPSS